MRALPAAVLLLASICLCAQAQELPGAAPPVMVLRPYYRFVPATSPAAPKYTITLLPLTPGTTDSEGFGLNNLGDVCGRTENSNGIPTAVLWKNGKPVKLPPLGGPEADAFAVNDADVVTGDASASDTHSHACLWQNGRSSDLVPTVGLDSEGRDINRQGDVVGYVSPGLSGSRPFLARGGASQIIEFPGLAPHAGVTAAALNERRHFVGQFDGPSAPGLPFLWDGAFHPLPLLPGDTIGKAVAINNRDQVVGVSGTHAVVWDHGTLTNLGVPGLQSGSISINDSGDIFGFFLNAADSHTHLFLKKGNTLFDLGPFQTPNVRMNSAYQIAGTILDHGHLRAFIASTATVKGTVMYEKVAVTSTGLNPASRTNTAAAGVLVEAVLASTGVVLGSSFTDASGNYGIPVSPPTTKDKLFIRASAEFQNGTKVIDPASSGEYSIASSSFAMGKATTVTKNLLAVDKNRSSGPFCILDTLRRANEFVLSADSTVIIPKVTVEWSPSYIGGTFFLAATGTAFINGDRSADSDEYDDTVINHEYGHFLTDVFSRSDSPNGSHSVDLLSDARLAWNEGWADFFGCASNNTSGYLDTLGLNGSHVFSYDLEVNVRPGTAAGYHNQFSVSSFLWDLFDTTIDPGDTVAAPWPEIWGAFTDLKKETYVYLLDFCEALHRRDHTLDAQMQALLTTRRMSYSPGVDPPVPDPFPAPIASGVSVTGLVDSVTSGRTNGDKSSDFYEIRLTQPGDLAADLDITGAAVSGQPADLDLFLLDQNGIALDLSAKKNGVGDSEHVGRTGLDPGYYVLEVRSWKPSSTGPILNAGTYKLTASY